MTRHFAVALAALLLLTSGCATTPPPEPVIEKPNVYSSPDLHTSFRVPDGWARAESWSPLHAAPQAVRFESPSRDSAVTLAYGPVGDLGCAAAARAGLLSVTGSVLRAVRAFDLQGAAGKIPAGQGETSGATSQGVARYFCAAQTTVVVETTAPKSSFADHLGDFERLLDSLVFDDHGQEVAVRPAAGVRAERAFFVHLVKFRGETAARIARWYTGSYESWREIALANEGLSSPNAQLKIGREVKIPSELVVRSTPFPEPPRSSAQAKGGKRAPEEAPSPAVTEAPSGQAEAPSLPTVIGPR
jgi:hypothetical protein